MDKIVIEKFWGTAEVGIYDVSMKLALFELAIRLPGPLVVGMACTFATFSDFLSNIVILVILIISL